MKNLIVTSLLVAYLALAVGGRSLLQYRRTGSFGLRTPKGGTAAWLGGSLLLVGVAAMALAATLDEAPPAPLMDLAGALLLAVGFAGTLHSQLVMGDAWRIGVDEAEKTSLIVRGPFRWVRNPIFASMIAIAIGVLLLIPGLFALTGAVAMIAGLEIHVRLVEEPHLVRTFGSEYLAYAARVGRFIPGLGRTPARCS